MTYDDVYYKVIETYKQVKSIKTTADLVGTTLVRTQRILITEGLWHSKSSDQVVTLYNSGKSVKVIAQLLCISEKTVQTYLPYVRSHKGYGGDNRSDEALRSENYRNRNKSAAQKQVMMNDSLGDIDQVNACKNTKIMLHSGEVRDRSASKKNIIADDLYDSQMNEEPSVLRLSLSLDMGIFNSPLAEEEKQILSRYGKVEKGITREILVPADITLHALNYAIQKAFGWQNSHLHHFRLPEDIFQGLTGGKNKADRYGYLEYDGKYQDFVKLCGLYFRSPSYDLEDIYWDDDYKDNESIKSWFKKKYTGPYKYKGYSEHYHHAHKAAMELLKQLDKDAQIQDVLLMVDGRIYELLERLPVMQVLYPFNISEDKELLKKIDEIAKKQALELVNIPIVPVTDNLYYEYDYGDGWEVNIKLMDCYYMDQQQVAYNMDNLAQSEELSSKIATVIDKMKPVCIAVDGLPVLDDVGGIHGYIDFMKNLHEGSKEEKEELKVWASFMGWTGRMNRAEKVL